MKKIFWILILFFVSLFSENNRDIENIMVYKTMNSSLTLADIKKKQDFFKPLNRLNQLKDSDATYWIKIALNKDLPSARYMVMYTGFNFDVSSFKHYQMLTKYVSKDNKAFIYSFFYNKEKSAKSCYFKVTNIFNNIKFT